MSQREFEKIESDEPLLPAVMFARCPIQTSLGVLGRKWTMLILRDIGFLRRQRFNEMLRVTPGLTPRVLSMRLKQLEKDGIIERVEKQKSPSRVKWDLTEKGRDTLPILMSFIQYGSKWYANLVFEDKSPRSLIELFPESRVRKFAEFQDKP